MDSAQVKSDATGRWVDDMLAELERRGIGTVPVLKEEPPSVDEMIGFLEALLERASSLPWSPFWRGDKGLQGIESKADRTLVLLAGGGELAQRSINLEAAVAAVNAAPHLIKTIASQRAVAKAADEEFRAMVAAFDLQAQRADRAEAAVGAVLEALGSDVELAMRHLDAKELGNHVAELREEALRAEKAEAEVARLAALIRGVVADLVETYDGEYSEEQVSAIDISLVAGRAVDPHHPCKRCGGAGWWWEDTTDDVFDQMLRACDHATKEAPDA